MYIGQISELSGYSQRMIRYLEDQGEQVLPEKATTLSTPPRTAYRIKKLEAVAHHLSSHNPGYQSDATIWKFIEFLRMELLPTEQNIEIFEIFRGSAQIVVLSGVEKLAVYEKAWQETSLPFYSQPVGRFPASELPEFFGSYEIVLEQKILSAANEVIFHALLPYQAVYIASGETLV